MFPPVDEIVQRITQYPLGSGFVDANEVSYLWNIFNNQAYAPLLDQVYAGVWASKGEGAVAHLEQVGAQVNQAHYALMGANTLNMRLRLAQTRLIYQLQAENSDLKNQLQDLKLINQTLNDSVSGMLIDKIEMQNNYNQMVKENLGLYNAVSRLDSNLNESKIQIEALKNKIKELESKPVLAQVATQTGEPEQAEKSSSPEDKITKAIEEWRLFASKMSKDQTDNQNFVYMTHMFKSLARAYESKNSHGILVEYLRLAATLTGLTYDHPVYTSLSVAISSVVLDSISDEKEEAEKALGNMVVAQLNVFRAQNQFCPDPKNTAQTDHQQRMACLRELVESYMTRFKDDPGLLDKNRIQKLQWMHSGFLTKNLTQKMEMVITPLVTSVVLDLVHDHCVDEIQRCQKEIDADKTDADRIVSESLDTIFNKINQRSKKQSVGKPMDALDKFALFTSFFLHDNNKMEKSILERYIQAMVPVLNDVSTRTFNKLSTEKDKLDFFEKATAETLKNLKKFRSSDGLISNEEYTNGRTMVVLLTYIFHAYSARITNSPANKEYALKFKEYMMANKVQIIHQHTLSCALKPFVKKKM